MDTRRHEDEVTGLDETEARDLRPKPPAHRPDFAKKPPPKGRRWRGAMAGMGVLLILAAALGYGALRYNSQHRDVMATAKQHRDFVPTVRVATVRASPGD